MARRPAQDVEVFENGMVSSHAEKMTVSELKKAVSTFYGLRTLVVDKAFAEAVLAYNTGNRRVNKRMLARLIKQMQTGEFINTGEPIILAAEGVLNNGQHRLMAVIESDAVVEMDFRFGISRAAFTKTDTGTARTSSDVLAIRGVTGSAGVAPAVRLLILFERGLPTAMREFVSNAEVDAAFQRWKGIEDISTRMGNYTFPKGVKSTALLSAAYMASTSPSGGRLDEWMDTLATGLGKGKTDPAYVLRERLIWGVSAPVGTREGLLEKFALSIMSWNAYAAGDGLLSRTFRWTASGRNAMPFPTLDGAVL